MMYKCDYCDKFFTSKKKLSDHERKVHPARDAATERNIPESKRATEQQVTPATVSTITKSEVATPDDAVETPAATPDDAPESGSYHCNDCGAAVERGQEICPGCGERLVWDDVE